MRAELGCEPGAVLVCQPCRENLLHRGHVLSSLSRAAALAPGPVWCGALEMWLVQLRG